MVASVATRRKYRDGEIVYERGEPEDTIGIVVSGKLKLFNPRADGIEIFSGLIHTGQNFGDAGLLHGGLRLHRSVAVGDTVVDHIERIGFEHLLGHPAILRAFYVVSSYRLKTTLGLLDDMRSLTPELRLANLLVRMQDALDGNGRLNFLQEEVAGMLGISTVTLAKAMRTLTAEGLIRTGYRHILINDAAGLRAWIAQRDPD